jgi:general secretion pathway protein K
MKRRNGFVLLIVLWTLGLLALLGTRLTATARAQLRLAAATRDLAAAEAAADAGIRQAMFALLDGGVGERLMRLRIGDAVVDVEAEDEAGRINPNTVSRDVLRGLLVAVGVDQPQAARLAGEIADWRIRGQMSVLGGPKIELYRDRDLPYRSGDHPFHSLNELGLVADMTPDILERLRPWMSVYHEGDVTDASGSSLAATAVSDVRLAGPAAVAPGFVSRNVIRHFVATAVMAGRTRFVRSATVRLRMGGAAAASTARDVIQVLTWE